MAIPTNLNIRSVTYNGVNIPLYQTTAFAYIDVTYPSGSVCTCSNGSITLTAADTSGKFVFGVTGSGSWIVAISNGAFNADKTLTITERYSISELSINYGTELNNLLVGDNIYIPVNRSRTMFTIIHKGLPSTDYDSSCDGVWVMTSDIYKNQEFSTGSFSSYKDATIVNYLNNTFYGLLDSIAKEKVLQIKLPYWNGRGDGSTISGSYAKGSEGLQTKVFLLSVKEVGLSSSYISVGAKLSYFNSSSRRIMKYNGTAAMWSLRDPSVATNGVQAVNETGSLAYGGAGVSYSNPNGIVPVFILPKTSLVNDTNDFIW